MSLVIPRLLTAVAGFLEKHGGWPTQVLVPRENWVAYQQEPGSAPDYGAADLVHAVLARVQLIPVPLQVYTAIDLSGRLFDYDGDRFDKDWREVIRRHAGM